MILALPQFLNDCFFFFFNDTATTEIYTLSLHDALPTSGEGRSLLHSLCEELGRRFRNESPVPRSEEHTSELQSRSDLVCRLLLEKKKKKKIKNHDSKKKKDKTIH